MSQYFPPSNQPPMGGYPQQPYAPQPGYQPTRTSAAAVISLICGVLGCLVITGVIAIITGIMGLSATSNPQVKGRGMAIAGIITGLIFGLCGGGCFLLGGVGYVFGSKEADKCVAIVDSALMAASKGETDNFKQYLEPGAFTDEQVNDFITSVRPWGTPGKFDKDAGWDMKNVNGIATMGFTGTVNYPNGGVKAWDVRCVKMPDGTYKIQNLQYR